MRMPGPVHAAAAIVLCAGLLSSAWAFDSTYELRERSSYLEGCFDPCMCPVMMNQSLRGSFQLTSMAPTADGSLFAVAGVDWQFLRGDEVVPVTGSGLYRVAPGQQRLTLDLVVGDLPLRHFDSGLVTRPDGFPEITIAVAVNGFFCYDYAFEISAVPAPVTETGLTWGAVKGIYR